MTRIAFLLGAGASIPAGYTSTHDLTQQILAPSGYTRHSSGRFVKADQPLPLDYRTPLVRRVIHWMFERVRQYYSHRCERNKVNYEDLYYLASQLASNAIELQNPALQPLINDLTCRMSCWPAFHEYCKYRHCGQTFASNDDFNTVAEITCHYIEDIVDIALRSRNKCFKHLQVLEAICSADDLELTGIATLAHDTHVETHLRESDVRLCDGFSHNEFQPGWRTWQDCFATCTATPFMKLHGSVDWKRLRCSQNRTPASPTTVGIHTGSTQAIGCASLHNPETDSAEYWEQLADGRPLLLIGTFNKPAQYSWSIMLDIHYRFRKVLESSTAMVVCGYSFGDKAINTQIVHWYNSGKGMVVIDPRDKSEVIDTARYAARKVLDLPTTQFVPVGLEEVGLRELKDALRRI